MSFFGNLSTLFGTQPETKQNQKPGQSVDQNFKGGNKPKFKKHKRPKKQHNKQEAKQQVVIPESIQQIRRDAEAKAREIIVEAKSEALQLRSKTEKEQRELNRQLEQQQQVLQAKLDRIDERLEVIGNKEEALENKRFEIAELRSSVNKEKEKVIARLEKVSTLTKEEAKEQLFNLLEKKLSKEMALYIRQKEEEAQTEADDKVKEILIDAMKHGATDYVPEYTISVVTLPSEDTKGKIIGKFEKGIIRPLVQGKIL